MQKNLYCTILHLLLLSIEAAAIRFAPILTISAGSKVTLGNRKPKAKNSVSSSAKLSATTGMTTVAVVSPGLKVATTSSEMKSVPLPRNLQIIY